MDLSGWGTSNVTNMNQMFNSCRGLTSVGNLSGWDTSNVTDMSYMFSICSSLTSIKVSSTKWSTAKVTSGDRMFYDCTALPNYDSSYVDHTYCSRYMTFV